MSPRPEGAHDLSAAGVLAAVGEVAARAADAYGWEAEPELISISENATFGLEDPKRGRAVLRVHRLGYHTRPQIESELAWASALRSEAGIRTPATLPDPFGRRVLSIRERTSRRVRHCVLFEHLPGSPPGPATPEAFSRLGELAQQMHRHSRRWRRPRGFSRFRWDARAAFGPAPRWGPWEAAPGIGPAERSLLDRAAQMVKERLRSFGCSPQRFGLLHADMRLANLLCHEGDLSVIDFDDCGFGWYLYDLATSCSFFEDSPEVPELLDAWLSAYRRSGGQLSEEDETEVWTFLMLRRLMLQGWVASHRAATDARVARASFVEGSCALAELYLSRTARGPAGSH